MWEVVITGIDNDKNQEEVVNQAATIFKIPSRKLQKILSTAPKVVKSGLDQSLAEKYAFSLNKIGLLAHAVEKPDSSTAAESRAKVKSDFSFRCVFISLFSSTLVFSLIALWVFNRLVAVEDSFQPVHSFDEEFAEFVPHSSIDCPKEEWAEIGWGITDYSYNVITDPKDKVFRYVSNLENSEDNELHIVGISHGTGRIAIGETQKPIILYLFSAGFSRWFLELEENVKIKKIVTHPRVTEINFLKEARSSLSENFIDYLVNPIFSFADIPIEKITHYPKCGVFYPGFQTGSSLNLAKERSLFVENLIGQREDSFQVVYGESSYYDQTFQIPVPPFEISEEAYERVYRPGVAMRKLHREPTRMEEKNDEMAKIRSMKRLPSIVADNSIKTVEQLLSAIKIFQDKKLLPTHIPRTDHMGKKSASEWLEIQSFRNAKQLKFTPKSEGVDCNKPRREWSSALGIVGNSEPNTVACGRGNQVYVLGDGEDTIDDGWDDDLIDAGPGNDMIDAGWGNDIIYFGYGWGEDIVKKTCHRSIFRLKDAPAASQYYWDKHWKYSNFIVFGPGIKREDIVNLGDKLVNKKTGDSIIMKSRCFNLVFDNEVQ